MITITIDQPPNLRLSLPLPPDELQPNAGRGMPRNLRQAQGGVAARNRVIQDYKSAAWAAWVAARKAQGMGATEITGPVTLLLTFFWPSRRSASGRDRDNAAASFKAGQDGIADGLGVNDRHVTQLPPLFEVDEKDPRVEAAVYFEGIEWDRRR
jgi:Holliday junction resolvase RusA-like endonuclease